MYVHLVHYVMEGSISVGGLKNWLKDNALPLILVVIGLTLFGSARKGDHSLVLSTVGLSLVALMVIAMGLSGTTGINVGRWLLHLFVPEV